MVVALIMVVIVVVILTLVAVKYTKWRKETHIYESPVSESEGYSYPLEPADYCVPIRLAVVPTHSHSQPHPLHTQLNVAEDTLTGSGEHIVMQACPAYVALEDTPTSELPTDIGGGGDYVYVS